MAIELVDRLFRLSLPNLIDMSNSVHTFMVRDAAQFALYGVSAPDIAAFLTLVNQLEAEPTDEELLGEQEQKTQVKINLGVELIAQIKLIDVRVAAKYGRGSGIYNSFGVGNISNDTDAEILVTARRVVRKAEQYLAELASEGLTQPIIDALEAKAQQFEDALNAQKDAISDRAIATVARINKANEVYLALVKYCDYGKAMWNNVNQAKYNDYVIYESVQNAVPGKILNLRYENDRFVWNKNSLAVSYVLESRPSAGGSWVAVGSTSNTYLQIPPIVGNNDYRVKGVNTHGSGDWSSVLRIDISPLSPVSNLNVVFVGGEPMTEHLLITWDNPAGADTIELWFAQETGTFNNPIPDGFVKIWEGTGSEYQVNMPTSFPNMKYYYAIARNGVNVSPQSNMAWIDMTFE